MITQRLIEEILSLYKKHGWSISRVLLCEDVKDSLNLDENDLFGDLKIETSAQVNAVWFSRPSKHGRTAWELRHLSEKPFAMFELFDENVDESYLNKTLKELENRLASHASNNESHKKA